MERPVVAGSSNSGAACPHLSNVTGRILGTFVRRVNHYHESRSTLGPSAQASARRFVLLIREP